MGTGNHYSHVHTGWYYIKYKLILKKVYIKIEFSRVNMLVYNVVLYYSESFKRLFFKYFRRYTVLWIWI